MIVCPNHHSVIHDANPVFDRRRMVYRFDNGVEERISLNKHFIYICEIVHTNIEKIVAV